MLKDKLKKIFTNWRVLVLLTLLVFSVIAIQPRIFGSEGVTLRSVAHNSSASLAGIENPSPKLTPLQKERVISINGQEITSTEQFYQIESALKENRTISLETNKKTYQLETKANEEGQVDLGLKVYDTPSTNLRKGLDLEGGTRVLLKPAEKITAEELELTIDNLRERLNVYGLSDIAVRAASDLEGQDFILIEIAGVTEEEIKELLGKQGKFEAKVGNETVFFGGKNDISYVCRSADCSGIDPRIGCSASGNGQACGFFFTISLSPEAAERQAAVTKELDTVTEGSDCYLSKDLTLFLDDKEVDTLRIGCELKGSTTTTIQISGSGLGVSQTDAVNNALQNMKKLQTVLVTGSLPVQLEIVKIDTISPSFGQEFISNVLMTAGLVVLAVALIVFLRYRKAKIIIPMMLTQVSEIVLVLGFAALVGWNLDMAAIAGIILVIGTGINHLVIITDETTKSEEESRMDWKQKIKNAMLIIIGTYLTVFAGMLPLFWAGAGLLKGFALTTIAGLSFGVLFARPAYAAVVEILLKE